MPNDAGSFRFSEILGAAIADLVERGYVSQEQIDGWLTLLRSAAERDLGPAGRIDADARRHMEALYRRLIEGGKILQFVPGIGRYTLAMVQPELRAELDRRILASVGLIRIHRREAIEKTLQRFQGWSTAIPRGGEGVVDKREIRAHVSKSIRDFKFERRRVDIDQGHKLIANVADIVAVRNGAIAAEWHSHWREPGYQYRPDHKERDGKVYAIRDSWAIRAGLMNKGAGYADDITRPSVEPFCRCTYRYLLSPRQLPDEMLTQKGRDWIAAGRERPGLMAA